MKTRHLIDTIARKLVLGRLAGIEADRLLIHDPLGHTAIGAEPAAAGLTAEIHVADLRFYRRVLAGGTLGAAEGYIDGLFTTSDLTTVMRILTRHLAAADDMERGLARLTGVLARVDHWMRRNTKAGSRANIHAHYDLGNDFFALFLDPTLSYSCGIFPHEHATMEEASLAKLDRLCDQLGLTERDHLLEIGTGWGGLALHAARRHGCRVTTTTISREQYELARARVREAGLESRIEVLLQDYRELSGHYDKLVSVEMIEAVGHENLPAFFAGCARLLRPGGVMALQAITMPDHRYERYRRRVDFIQRFVFPGSCVPSIAAMTGAMAKASDLRLIGLHDIGLHYARTLAHWRARFMDNLDEVRRLGHSEEFIRLWDYYLCYCEGGFAERYISTVQMVLARPQTASAGARP